MNTIKDYYVEILNLYNSSLKILTALNTALSSQAATVPLTILDDNSSETIINIPSFLYLENKMSQVQNMVNLLVNIPKTGEAWFSEKANTYKLNMVSVNNAPSKIVFDTTKKLTSIVSDNDLFKDMVLPKLSLRCRVNQLSPDVHQIAYQKIVFYSKELFDSLSSSYTRSYPDVISALSGYVKGEDWDSYESVTTLPLRSRDTRPLFSINNLLTKALTGSLNNTGVITTAVIEEMSSVLSSYTDRIKLISDLNKYLGKNYYDVRFSQITYASENDPSMKRTLKPGMMLQTSKGYCKIYITAVPYQVNDDNIFRLIVVEGSIDMHQFESVSGQTWSDAYDTYLIEDDNTWMPYTFVDIPLEENPYIAVFVAAVRNNIRSNYSNALYVNLNDIYMVDETGANMVDATGKNISYITYYKQFAKNAGDALMSLISVVYPGIDTLKYSELSRLQYSVQYKPEINTSKIVVTAINTHLTDDTAINDIKTLHAQKSELLSQLQTVKTDISNIINTIADTDFALSLDVTRASLSVELDQAYAKRTLIEKQIIATVHDINTMANSSVIPTSDIKYRLRGVIDTSALEAKISLDFAGVSLVGLDIQYKYKSTSKDTTATTNIGNATFTSWNRYYTDKKDRIVNIKNGNLILEEYVPEESDNVIKWNQVDIPIQQAEDVIIRVRGIYSCGQPFVNIYTPWSDEVTFQFPENYTINADMREILSSNKNDTTDAVITSKLIEDGYEEHVNNKVVDNGAVYYHAPENIASGFYTAEQKIVPLKDKLFDISSKVDNLNKEVENIKGLAYKVVVQCENKNVEMAPNGTTTLTMIPYAEHLDKAAKNAYVSKNINIIIKNTGTSTLRLYSLFPGDRTKKLVEMQSDFYILRGGDYDVFPVWSDGGFRNQSLSQWVYFRNTNPWTESYDNFWLPLKEQKKSWRYIDELVSGPNILDYIPISKLSNHMVTVLQSQYQLGFRYRSHEYYQQETNFWGQLGIDSTNGEIVSQSPIQDDYILSVQAREEQSYWVPMNFVGRYDGMTWKQIIEEYKQNNPEEFSVFSDEGEVVGMRDLTNTDILKAEITWPLGFGYDLNYDLMQGSAQNSISNNLEGAFLFPEFESHSQLLTNSGKDESYYEVPVGESVTIPLTFQYFLTSIKNSVSKTIYFDIKPSVLSNPEHYKLQINARYASTSSVQNTDEKDQIAVVRG